MLETIDFSLEPLSKEEYKPRYDALIDRLVVLQQQARAQGVGLVVLFEGWNGAGKGSRISDLLYNLDARATSVHVTENMDMPEAHMFKEFKHGVSGFYPGLQDFWKSLGERGTITFFDRGWYTKATQHMLFNLFGDLAFIDEKQRRSKKVRKAFAHAAQGLSRSESADTLTHHIDSMASFERQLVNDGYVVVKCFVHVRKQTQKVRLEGLYNNPATRWRTTPDKLKRLGNYKEAYQLYDALLEGTDFDFAPWEIINGEDKRAANIHIAQTLVKALSTALENKAEEAAPADEQPAVAPQQSRFPIAAHYPTLDEVDHTLALEFNTYRKLLKAEQRRLNRLEMEMYQRRIPLMIMYEGWDAAGKGGNIKRVAQSLDARAYTVFPSPAPTKPELMHPHLWRYWTRLPKAGHVGIYDRSWYGRVLVERVEGFATPGQWARAYDEINEFERDLVQWGAILLKFWVDVSQEEQLNRFTDRATDPAKQWKITDDDWRNREKYPAYKAAIEDMFRLTSTTFAPWIVLESDDKRHARVKSLQIINDTLEARLREK